jgi:DNA-binding MarR family transcriptional regulator
VLVLTRARNTRQAVLKLTGRDVAEAEYAMELDASIGLWTMLDGPAADLDLTDERRRIVAAVRNTEGLGPKQIADVTGLSHNVVKQLVRRMVDAGQIDTDGAGHYLPLFTPFTPFTEGQDQ